MKLLQKRRINSARAGRLAARNHRNVYFRVRRRSQIASRVKATNASIKTFTAPLHLHERFFLNNQELNYLKKKHANRTVICHLDYR